MKLRINIFVVMSIILVTTLTGCTGNRNPSLETKATLILTRHAERIGLSDELTDYGHARAQALAKAAANMDITAIYTLNYKRNLDTVRPLADHLGLKINIINKKPVAREIVDMIIKNHPGKVVLWMGNVGNINDIYNHLSGEGDAPDDYGDIFTIKIKDKGFSEVIKDTYGAP